MQNKNYDNIKTKRKLSKSPEAPGLPSEQEDILEIKRLAKSMGVDDDNVFENYDDSMMQIEANHDKIRTVIKDFDTEEKHCTLLIYSNGYSLEVLGM